MKRNLCRVIRVEVTDEGTGTAVQITVARPPEGSILTTQSPPVDMVPLEMREALSAWLGLPAPMTHWIHGPGAPGVPPS